MKEKYLKFCDYVARACGAFAVLALLLSILVIVELAYMDKDDFNAWLEIAKKSSYKNFADKVPGGQKLIDMALAVK